MITVHMIGNAHIDPVWLWPWQVGVDEVLATFRSAVDRCSEYPEFIFTRGEAWCYRQVEQLDPELFQRVRGLVAKGQWHITGGQWIQPDVNLPTWEGLRRQILHGQRYFRDHFNVRPQVGYNVDSFGHPATLPDLLSSEGYIGYVFHRPNQEQTPLPAATFRWRGVGGGEVMGFRIPAPYTTRSDDLYGQIMLSLDAADERVGHIMCFYGVGNHGGGPTKGNIEYILEHANDFKGARLEFSTPQRFFEAVQSAREKLPLVDFELQRTFPGCYVVMQDIKRRQRHGELLLQQTADAIEHFAEPAERTSMNRQLDVAWEDLLFTEFHDILAGTSIAAAWESVRAMQGRARIIAEELLVTISRRWSRKNLPAVNHQQIAIINPAPSRFTGVVEHEPFLDFAGWDNRWLADERGNPIDFQHVQPQSTIMLTPAIVFEADIAARGAQVIVVRDDKCPARSSSNSDLYASPEQIGNAHLKVRLGGRGIEQLTHQDRDLLNAPGMTLLLRQDKADTWGFHIDRFDGAVSEQVEGLSWIVEETSPIRARVRAEATLGRSSVRWTLTLHRSRPAILVSLDVLYAERYQLLQLATTLADVPPRWRSGLAGGAVTREVAPTEWPVQSWAHVITGGSTLAMMTQDANSASVNANVWAWSLLRAPRMAWSGGDAAPYSGRDDFADQGIHRFDFEMALLPDEFSEADLHAAAESHAQRPIIFDRYEGMNRPPWKNNPPRRLWTPAEHRARKDGRMMHLNPDVTESVEERRNVPGEEGS